jgi:hypothetical protein
MNKDAEINSALLIKRIYKKNPTQSVEVLTNY